MAPMLTNTSATSLSVSAVPCESLLKRAAGGVGGAGAVAGRVLEALLDAVDEARPARRRRLPPGSRGCRSPWMLRDAIALSLTPAAWSSRGPTTAVSPKIAPTPATTIKAASGPLRVRIPMRKTTAKPSQRHRGPPARVEDRHRQERRDQDGPEPAVQRQREDHDDHADGQVVGVLAVAGKGAEGADGVVRLRAVGHRQRRVARDLEPLLVPGGQPLTRRSTRSGRRRRGPPSTPRRRPPGAGRRPRRRRPPRAR